MSSTAPCPRQVRHYHHHFAEEVTGAHREVSHLNPSLLGKQRESRAPETWAASIEPAYLHHAASDEYKLDILIFGIVNNLLGRLCVSFTMTVS